MYKALLLCVSLFLCSCSTEAAYRQYVISKTKPQEIKIPLKKLPNKQNHEVS
jgi:hypothetical protein